MAEEASVAPLVVQPPFSSRSLLCLLLDPIDHGSDDWTCQRLTGQEFFDQIRKELLEKLIQQYPTIYSEFFGKCEVPITDNL